MKKLVVFILILMTSSLLFSVTKDEANLAVKAYKMSAGTTEGIYEFEVTDALADFNDLNRLPASGHSIIVDSHIDKFLGQTGSFAIDDVTFSERILFSIRVAGRSDTGTSGSDSYKVSFSFDPFKHRISETSSGASPLIASYQLGNVTGVFAESSAPTSTSGNTEITITGITITDAQTGANGPKYVRVDDTTGKFDFSWAIAKTNDSSSTETLDWTVRAAVAMTLDRDSYEGCTQYGEHFAPVTVTLTSN